jgi:hypothetical protein
VGDALMMEAARTSETLVNFYQTTRRYNTEDSHLWTQRFIAGVSCSRKYIDIDRGYCSFVTLQAVDFQSDLFVGVLQRFLTTK